MQFNSILSTTYPSLRWIRLQMQIHPHSKTRFVPECPEQGPNVVFWDLKPFDADLSVGFDARKLRPCVRVLGLDL